MAEQPVLNPRGAPPEGLAELLPAVVALGEKYRYDTAHAEQVARLAVQLFGALTAVHGLPAPYEAPLRHAALLHDIGYFLDARGHHRHSRYLIRNDALLDEYPPEWRTFVALVAANHRRRVRPGPRAWGRQRRAAATALAALLRLADGLDYGHDAAARLGPIRVRDGRLELTVSGLALGPLRPVLRKKGGLFTATFALPLGFAAPDAD